MTGKTQSYARQVNNQLIMRELRACGKCSATMLARKLNLSNAALTAILLALQQKGYITRLDERPKDKTVGRNPVYYSVNASFGCVAVIELANHVATVVIADMGKNILHEATLPAKNYDMSTLSQLVVELTNALRSHPLQDVPLMGIQLSVAGRVNIQTGQLQLSPQFNADLFATQNAVTDLFYQHFGVPVWLSNDVNLALLGEATFGMLQDAQNAMLVHLDEGVGGAFVFQGKPYLGQNGFAGEIGLMHAEQDGRIQLLDECVSLRAVKKMLSATVAPCSTFNEVSALYENSSEARAAVIKTAETLGKALKDVVELLDISTIVLSGRLPTLDGYAEAVDAIVKQSPACATVTRTNLAVKASVLGAISKAVETLTDSLFG